MQLENELVTSIAPTAQILSARSKLSVDTQMANGHSEGAEKNQPSVWRFNFFCSIALVWFVPGRKVLTWFSELFETDASGAAVLCRPSPG